jgi:hypothetical protein
MKRRLITLFILLSMALSAVAGERPKLIVNFVVSHMRESDLARYEVGFGEDGFKRLMKGTYYPYVYYPFAPTTPSALATLSTGALPAVHGITGEGWWNQTTQKRVSVVSDPKCMSFNCDTEESKVSNANLIFETIGDVVVRNTNAGRSVTVASDASSAIILGGTNPTEVWWLDSLSATWTTSSKYHRALPKWVKDFNNSGYWLRQLGLPWILSKRDNAYLNSRSSTARPYGYKLTDEERTRRSQPKDLREVLNSYVANDVVALFAEQAIINNYLGADEEVDMINICFDSPRRIAARYGLSSREMEDMYYRLDQNIANIINFAETQAGGSVIFTLTSDGGNREYVSSDKVFNSTQARFLINSFLSATYGKGDWVLGCENCSFWLNHTLIFSKGLDVSTVQHQVANFALQLRGVSHALSASDMAASGTLFGVMELIQNSYYPKRSPDVTLVLMPDWCNTFREDYVPRTSSQLIYAPYRRSLIAMCGMGVENGVVINQKVDMRSFVVSLARMLGMEAPIGAEWDPLPEAAPTQNGR